MLTTHDVVDSIICNYSGKQNIIDYSFEVGFPHLEKMPNSELISKCIMPAIERFYIKHKEARDEHVSNGQTWKKIPHQNVLSGGKDRHLL